MERQRVAAQGQVNERVFDTEELFIRIKCDVHPWMFACVPVFSHPYFAVTDANGAFQFPAPLPSGTYTIAAQHHRAGEVHQKVTVGSGEQAPLQFP